MANAYEMLARERKATLLAEALGSAGIPPRQLDAQQWRDLARSVGVRPPSPATIAAVIARLDARNALNARLSDDELFGAWER